MQSPVFGYISGIPKISLLRKSWPSSIVLLREIQYYLYTMQTLANYITVDSEIQFGKPVFKGTRVPVQSLFWHIEKGILLEEFLEDFPSVTREQAEAVIEWTAKHFKNNLS